MRKFFICFGLVSLVGACGDPLADVAKISEVELLEKPAQVDVLAAPVDVSDTRPLFQRLLGKKAAPDVTPEPSVEQDAIAEAVGEAVEEAVVASAESPAVGDVSDSEIASVVAPEPEEKPKLLSFLKHKPAVMDAEPLTVADTKRAALAAQNSAESKAEIVQASLTVEAAENPNVRARKERNGFKGLFSARKAAALTGPDALLVEPGTHLPFGTIARVCALKRGDMGSEVERSSDGKGKFRLYDSAPGSISPRAFYITGFDDGCPRQVTAALALFGDVEQHEALRYGEATKGQPWSDTDSAYEKIKRQVCKTGKGKPCGVKLPKLEKSTSFLTVYNTFVGAQSWRNVLLHDGSVVAMN